MRPFICLLLWLSFGASVLADHAQDHELNITLLENAISQVEADTSLAEEERSALLDSYRRSQGYIRSTQSYAGKTAAYRKARETAFQQAKNIKKGLEAEQSKEDGGIVEADKTLDLTNVEQVIQREKAELAALEAKLSDVRNQLQAEADRPKAVRTRLTELTATQDELAASQQTGPSASNSEAETQASVWLMDAQDHASRAEIAMLEEELLSQPMRLDLLKAQSDQFTYNQGLIKERIRVYEAQAIDLRQGGAAAAESAAKDAEQQAAGKHQIIQNLAEANSQLTEHVSQIATELAELKAENTSVSEQAVTFEKDLAAVQQKLEIVGMSQALGQILRDQRARLPDSRFSRSENSRREQKISESSLRQLEYEEERHRLRNVKEYVKELAATIPPEEADAVQADLLQLATTRKDIINRALDVEAAYLRALGDLDYGSRRLRNAADEYGQFIAQRLLWIRTAAPFSLKTFLPVPDEVGMLLDPTAWSQLAMWLPSHLLDSPIEFTMVLLIAALLLGRRPMRALLTGSAKYVGVVQQDKFRYTWIALGLTVVLALGWPLLLWTMGLTIADLGAESAHAAALGQAMMRISYYYLGLEFVRLLVFPGGLVERHFNWAEETCAKLYREVITLERIFVPAVVIGIFSGRLHPVEGSSVLSMLTIIVCLIALARFFYRLPSFLHGRLDQLLGSQKPVSSGIWGKGIRWFLIIVPCVLIICILIGYGNTAIAFLQLLLMTNALIVLLVLIHEMGQRWFKIVRRRLMLAEKLEARKQAREKQEGDEVFEEDFDDFDTETLDDEGRKLLSAILSLAALVGVVSIWSDVLPALGILDSVQLWNETQVIDGKDTLVAVTLADIGVAILIAALGWIAIKRIPHLLELLLRQKLDLTHGSAYAAGTLFRYVLVAMVVISVLGTLGGSWSQIQWAVAALSVGIGFGLQEIVANFISGLILLFEQPIRVGDTVTVGETSGVVTRIRMRATTIRDWDRRELLVPNKEFITGRLLNWSLSDQVSRFEVVVGVAYGTNLKKAMEVAIAAAAEHPDVMEDPEPFVTFDDFGDNSLKLVLRCFIASVDKRLSTSSAVRLMVEEKYREAGIVVAFPQRDIHLNTSDPLDITLRNADPAAP